MARPSLARRLGVASLLTTMVLTSASCGGDDDGTATDDSSTSSSDDSSTDETTDETTDDSTDDGAEPSGDLEELAAGDFYAAVTQAMLDAETMAFTSTSTGGPASTELSGVAEYGDDGVSIQASTTGAQAFEMILEDKVMYISGAGLPLPDGKKWAKIDLSDPNSLYGQLGKTTDPSAIFGAMEDPKTFELLGTEEVDGVETNHYNVVMDTKTYAEALDLPAEMVSFMPKEIGVEMWVDADNQPRKFYQETETPDMTGSGKTTTTITEGTYSDFGLDVDIEAPPAAEVADNVPGLS